MSAPSERTVTTRFGTHWRWRVALLVIALALFASGWNVARWWWARVLVRGTGEPAIVRVTHSRGESLELFDWTSGKWRTFAEIPAAYFWFVDPLQVVLDGKAVAWQRGEKIHIAPTDGSGVRTLQQLELDAGDQLLGLTRDENFAFVCAKDDGVLWMANGRQSMTRVVHVLDLRSGEIVHAERWMATPAPAGSSGEIVGTRLSPESFGRWSFSIDDGWQESANAKPSFNERHLIDIVRGSEGQLIWTGFLTPTTAAQVPETWAVTYVSPSGDRFIANHQEGQCAIFDQRTGKAIQLDLPWGICPYASFTPDSNTLLFSDLFDDIHVIDAATGRLVAKDSAGSRRRTILLAIASVGLLVSAAWLWIAFLEQSARWAVIDTLVTLLIISLSMVGMALAIAHPGMNWTNTSARMIFQGLVHVEMGISAGAILITAWYWAHGDGPATPRWALGVVGLAIFLLPIPMLERWTSWWVAARAITATAIFATGITALVVWIPHAMGWTIRNRPAEGPSHRFGLGAIFAVITSLGILLALGKWLDPSQWNNNTWIIYGLVEMLLVGTALVAILFSRLSWDWMAGGFLLVAGAIFLLICLRLVGMSARNPNYSDIYVMEAGALIGTTLAALLPCLILRRHGFRWTRASAPVCSPSTVPT